MSTQPRKSNPRKGTKKNNVILRKEKPLANGNISLYLDIYRDGKPELMNFFLKLYINAKPRTPIEREANREGFLNFAEKIRTQKRKRPQPPRYMDKLHPATKR